MSEIRIVRDYPYPVITVWRALTDPALVPLWTSTGQGGRPEGFTTEVGTRFRFIGKPFPGWDGIVRCEVLDVEEPLLLRYDWRNKQTDQPTVVTNILEEIPGGTRLTWQHTGFHGIEGAFMSRLLGRVRRKMLSQGLPAVLADIGAGVPVAGSQSANPWQATTAREAPSRAGRRQEGRVEGIPPTRGLSVPPQPVHPVYLTKH